MNTKTTTFCGSKSTLAPISKLSLQDECYAKRRQPEGTPAGAESRTYCFRVEFEHDLYPLSHMLRWATETWWSSPICPGGDADVKVTLKRNTLNLEEIRWLFARVVDCHVAVETVELEANYTGERKYQTEQELPATAPSTKALTASLAGLTDYRESLEAAAGTAMEAEAEIEREINTRCLAKRMTRAPRASAKSVPLNTARSERATSQKGP